MERMSSDHGVLQFCCTSPPKGPANQTRVVQSDDEPGPARRPRDNEDTMTSTPTDATIAIDAAEIELRLTAFLQGRLGQWPPRQSLEIVPWPARDEPGWNGGTLPLVGIESPLGTVLSVSPTAFPDVATVDPTAVEDALGMADDYMLVPALFGRPDLHFGRGVFRSIGHVVDLPDVGEWVPNDDPRLPEWLRPFNGDVLVVWDDEGRYAAGVGRKKHNRYGHEISVGTEPAHRGKGLARNLVAQAARRVLREGAVPIYLHSDRNAASMRVAEGAGFPDRDWHIVELR
jgi:GNAT superfamily N-acetyltransferase